MNQITSSFLLMIQRRATISRLLDSRVTVADDIEPRPPLVPQCEGQPGTQQLRSDLQSYVRSLPRRRPAAREPPGQNCTTQTATLEENNLDSKTAQSIIGLGNRKVASTWRFPLL